MNWPQYPEITSKMKHPIVSRQSIEQKLILSRYSKKIPFRPFFFFCCRPIRRAVRAAYCSGRRRSGCSWSATWRPRSTTRWRASSRRRTRSGRQRWRRRRGRWPRNYRVRGVVGSWGLQWGSRGSRGGWRVAGGGGGGGGGAGHAATGRGARWGHCRVTGVTAVVTGQLGHMVVI